jgi:hypothetical protein
MKLQGETPLLYSVQDGNQRQKNGIKLKFASK